MKRRNVIYGVFEVGFFVVLCLIIIISLTGTQYHIAWYKEAFVTAVWLVCLTVLFFLLKRLEKWLGKYEKIVLPIFCVLWGIALYVFSCFSRNGTSQDYQIVYGAVMNYIKGTEVAWWYFAIWKNNYFLFLILSSLAKLSSLLGFQDPFYFILLFSVIMAVWGGICIYRLLEECSQSIVLRWAGLFLFVGFIPCWGGTQYFYTDAMSICFGVWACLLTKKAFQGAGRYYWYAGVVWGIGYAVKATVAISMLAVLAITLVALQWKEWKKLILLVLGGFLIVLGGVECLWHLSPSYEMEDEMAAPLEYWLALGISGEGSYVENEEFAEICIATPGREAKREVARAYIKENMKESLDLRRLSRKVRCNFATGFFGLPAFHERPGTFAYEFFSDWGTYGGYVAMLTTGYFYAILALGAVSCICALCGLKKGKTSQMNELVTQLTVFGLIWFLMIWEANNRQLYNHMPWFAMMGAYGLVRLFEKENELV